MAKRTKRAREEHRRDVRTTLLVVRAKLRQALALSLGRRDGD
jgi:hypothetical protein